MPALCGHGPAAESPLRIPRAAMLVMKFGGTSLEGPEALERVARIIRERSHDGAVVVVSAMGSTTDLLLECAESDGHRAAGILRRLGDDTMRCMQALLPEPELRAAASLVARVLAEAAPLAAGLRSRHGARRPSAELDALLACGERISSRLVHLVLSNTGLPAEHLDARELFVTRPRHGGAEALYDATRRRIRTAVRPVLAAGRIPVVGGFIARDQSGTPTTLGRGGSDCSASLAGAALGATEVQIWTDVDGVMTADPSLITAARSLPVLSLLEASELAYFGGRVLHPSTMLPAIRQGIPIRVLNSMRPERKGTLIVSEIPASPSVVKSIVYKENITLIDIYSTRMLMAHGFLARIFAVFDRHETAVDMVSTSEVSVSMTVDQPDKVPTILRDLESFSDAHATSGKAIVCVVGEGIRYTPGIAATVLGSLDGIRIRMISLGASRVNVGFVVDEDCLEDTVRRLHATFFP